MVYAAKREQDGKRPALRGGVALAAALVLSATALAAAEPPLVDAGLARVDITPTEPVRLNGYRARKEPTEKVAGRIWAKALAIGAERPAVLITVDNTAIPRAMTDAVRRRLAKDPGVPAKRVAICMSHSHTTPKLKGAIPYIFGRDIPSAHEKMIERYTAKLEDWLVEVAREAIASRAPARLSWGQGEVGFATNRRELRDGQWVGFGTNEEGPVDHSMPLLRVSDPDGELRGVLVNYACHTTTLTGQHNFVHGDWAGAAQKQIEAEHPGAIAMVSIGCGADANPKPRGKLKHVKQHGKALADEVDSLLKKSLRPIGEAPQCRLERFDLPLQSIPPREEWEKRASGSGRLAYYAEIILDRLDRGKSIEPREPYSVQTWTFGETLAMVFLPGEVVVDYAIRLDRVLDASRLWINGYSNALPCYVVTDRILSEGGYEPFRSLPSFDMPAPLSPRADDRIVRRVRKLLPAAYK